jgi:pSer/pThr/pTyr-binding forkhead associated (FHA) protein
MRPLVEVRLDDGSTVELGPGDLIGRVASAALVLDDPRISEAHAMVSLRGGELYLLALRRLVGHHGKPVSEVLLETGSVIELADGISVTATRVIKPRRVQALRAPGLGVRPLGQVASVVTGPPLRIVGRFVPGASAHVWSSRPEEWRLREADRPTRTIVTGDRFVAAGVELELCEIALDAANLDPTVNQGGVTQPLRIVTISIWRLADDQLVATLRAHSKRVAQLAFTRDGKLVSGGWDGMIVTWDFGALETPATDLVRDAERAWAIDLPQVLR